MSSDIRHYFSQYALYFAARYVDNRVLWLPTHLAQLPSFRQLTDPSCNRSPVQLETEPANVFLGFAVIHTTTASRPTTMSPLLTLYTHG